MSSPSEGIKSLLLGAGAGSDASDLANPGEWPIHISKMESSPDEIIVIYDIGGKPPNPQFRVNYPSVQITVRGTPNGYFETRIKCVEIVKVLLGLPSQDLNGDRWVSVAQTGDINWLGYDANKKPQFSMNFALIIEPSVTDNRESL